MSKKSRPWSRQGRAAIRKRGIIGRWRRFANYYLSGHRSFVEKGGDWAAMARRFDREYQCPVCRSRPTKCVCLGARVRAIFVELGIVKVPWASQGDRGWLDGEHPDQRRNRARQKWRAYKKTHAVTKFLTP